MKDKIIEYIKDNKKVIYITSILILIGIISGIISFNFLDEQVKVNLIESIKSTFEISKQEGYKGVNIFKSGIRNNLFMYGLFIISSFIIISPIIICILCLIKGFSIGILIASIYNLFLNNSFLPILLLAIVPNIIIISVIIYICLEIINMYYSSDNLKKRSIYEYVKLFFKFSFTIPFVIVSIFIEQMMFKIILDMYVNM